MLVLKIFQLLNAFLLVNILVILQIVITAPEDKMYVRYHPRVYLSHSSYNPGRGILFLCVLRAIAQYSTKLLHIKNVLTRNLSFAL